MGGNRLSEVQVLEAETRIPGHPNRDRARGFVPAVVYGHGTQPLALGLERHGLELLLSHGGTHRLLRLHIAGEAEPRTVVIKEVQRHPVRPGVLHVDFQAVRAQERIHAEVPLRLHGEEAIAKRGGILQVTLHTLRVSCLPGDLPDHLDVQVSEIVPGQAVTVGDLDVPAGLQVLHDPADVVLSGLQSRTVAADAAAPPEAKG